MKLTKSKQFLANVINASWKGWPHGANWACQPQHGAGDVHFCKSETRPYREEDYFTTDSIANWFDYKIEHVRLLPNWHQAVLSREEYFSAYPAEPVADAYGWIATDGRNPVISDGLLVDVRYADNVECHGIPANMHGDFESACGMHSDCCAYDWSEITAYRLHKPEVKPELCESVMSSIPEQEPHEKLSQDAVEDAKIALMSESVEESKRKPTIEQLISNYRNKLDYTNRKQQEADDAKASADEALGELVAAGEAIDLVIGIAKHEPELVITDWRNLKVGDEVEYVSGGMDDLIGRIGVVTGFDPSDIVQSVKVSFVDDTSHCTGWPRKWRFIRRP